MVENTAYCLFCNQLKKIVGGDDIFALSWITRLELEDCSGLKQVFEGKGTMFLCHECRERMHSAIENNAKLVLDDAH